MEKTNPAAESSTATATPERVPLEKLNSEQYSTWRQTGELPKAEQPTNTDDPASSTPAENAGEAKTSSAADPNDKSDKTAGSAPDPESGKAQEPPKKKGIKERTAELDTEIKTLQEKLRIRAELREQVGEGVPKKDEKTADSSAAKSEKQPPAKPKLDDFQTYEEYETANDAYIAQLASFEAEKAVDKYRADQEAKSRQAEQEKARKAITDKWQKSVAEVVKEHPDYQLVAEEAGKLIPQNSAMDAFIVERANAKLIYHLGQNPAEIARIAALSSIEQILELHRLEQSVSGNKPSPARAGNGQFVAGQEGKAPEKKISTAPNPPSEITGKGTAPEDEAAHAAKTGNFTAYKAAMDAEDLRSRKG